MTSHARNTHCLLSDTTENAEALKLFIDNLFDGNQSNHLGERDVIVVAAPKSLTQHLQSAVSAACSRDQAGVNRSLRTVLEIQHALISQTLGEENASRETAQFLGDVQSIIKLLKNIPDRVSAQFVISMGETWTARLLVANLQLANIESETLDSSNLVRTRSESYLGRDSNSRTNLQKSLAIVPGVAVLPAVAIDELGHNVVCAANHFATFVSRTLNSHTLTTWTHSDRLVSAEHPEIPTQVLDSLSQAEVDELSRLSHDLFPYSDKATSTEFCVRHVSGECLTGFTKAPNATGVKLVHTLDAIRILHIDCTGSNTSAVTDAVEKTLAKVGVEPLATDVDKDGDRVSLAFPANMAEYVRGVLRTCQFKAMSIEEGKALVAIVGDGLAEDWLLSFKFQQTLGSTICMTAKTDVSHVAILDSPESATEAVPTIYAELIEQPSAVA